jgi:hypothetical protein
MIDWDTYNSEHQCGCATSELLNRRLGNSRPAPMLSLAPLNAAERPRISDSNFDSNASERARILAADDEYKENGNPEIQSSRSPDEGSVWWRWGRVELRAARPLMSMEMRRARNFLPSASPLVHRCLQTSTPVGRSCRQNCRQVRLSGRTRRGACGCCRGRSGGT